MTNAATTVNTDRTAIAYLHPRTWGAGEQAVEVHVPIKFRKREGGVGYYITRRDTGQDLGMTGKGRDGWKVWALNGAYYTADEAEDLMTRTNPHPSHRAESGLHGELITVTDSRAPPPTNW